MDVFIHEEYVTKRNEVRRERRRRQQLRMLQVPGNIIDASRPAPAPRESPGAPVQCVTPSGASPSSVRSPTASVSPPASAERERAAWPPEHRLFDCLKPY